MKSLSALCLLCVFINMTTYGQTFTAIKAGAGVSNLKFKNETNYNARFSWYGGLLANFDVDRQFFIRTELLYSLRGYRQQATATATSGKVSYSHLSLPLLAGYTPIKNVSVMAGPELGYMLTARSKDETSTRNIIHFIDNRFSVDANAGISWSLTPELAVETHFLIGLTSLYRMTYIDAMGNSAGTVRDGFHRVWQAGIVYKMSEH